MRRRCSHCSNNGHNARTCPINGGGGGGGGFVKLFGVKITNESTMKKSASMGNLNISSSSRYHSFSQASPCGYLSDDPAHESCLTNLRCGRKKGVAWTQEEHRMFLLGLSKMGKGDWRGISRNFVISRTPTQVASHAQKYFIRQTSSTGIKKRRSSLFDMSPQMANNGSSIPGDGNTAPSSNVSLDCMEAMQESDKIVNPSSPVLPQFFPVYLPFTVPFWLQNVTVPVEEETANKSCHQVVKPVPVLPREALYVDEAIPMSQLRLGPSLKRLEVPQRQSAFQANIPARRLKIVE